MANQKKISLFIPCLVDQFYPDIGFAMVKILRYFDYDVNYNANQTCCGQPAFNAGHRGEARKVAEKFIDIFISADIIVAPSGSSVRDSRMNEAKVLIYPNPADNICTIDCSAFVGSDIQIELINMQGKCLLRNNIIKNTPGISSKNLDTSGLPQGLYFLKFTSSEIPVQQKLLSIQH